MIIVQISDSHISIDSPIRAARLGDLERTVAEIRRLDPVPDLVVHTGDITQNGLPEEYRAARDSLDRLPAPLYVIPGNRDRRAAMYDAFENSILTGPGPAKTPFLQYAIEGHALRLIMLDTLSRKTNLGVFDPDRLAELAALLAAEPEHPTALFMHHPPFDVPGARDPFQFADRGEAAALGDLLQAHRQVIGLSCGHTHRFAPTTFAGRPAMTIASIAGDLRKGCPDDAAMENTDFLIHRFDSARGLGSERISVPRRTAPAAGAGVHDGMAS